MRLFVNFILGIALVSAMSITSFVTSFDAPEFLEIKRNQFEDTSSPIVEIGYKLYVVNGDGDGNFRPDDPITHAEFAQMCYNAFSPDPGSIDRNVDPWYEPAFRWLYLQTITTSVQTLSDTSMRKLFDVYSDGRSAEMLQRDDTYASYEHMVNMLFVVCVINDGLLVMGDVTDAAPRWAAATGPGYAKDSSAWRKGSDERITREEALHLILGLTGLIEDYTDEQGAANI